MKRIPLLLWTVALCGNALYGAGSTKGDFLTAPITREQLAKKLADFSRAPIDAQELHIWVERLEDKEPIKTDASFEKSLQVRDVALAVLEAVTGEAFSVVKSGKATPVKEIVMCRIGDTPWRFHIVNLTDEEYEGVARNVRYWVDGYEAGLKKHKKPHQ
jgi:hypothetical protein